MTVVMSVARFERFFRSEGLDVDKEDLRRHSEFVNQKTYDLLIRGKATAKANGREVIEPFDLPITKGLQECIQAFGNADVEFELTPILDGIAGRPQIGMPYSEETETELPAIVGGLSVALARTLKVINPDLKNPQTKHWDAASRIFNLIV
jgi:hypothetical protein